MARIPKTLAEWRRRKAELERELESVNLAIEAGGKRSRLNGISTTKEILETIRSARGSFSAREIGDAFRITQTHAGTILRRLTRAGYLVRTRAGDSLIRFRATRKGH